MGKPASGSCLERLTQYRHALIAWRVFTEREAEALGDMLAARIAGNAKEEALHLELLEIWRGKITELETELLLWFQPSRGVE